MQYYIGDRLKETFFGSSTEVKPTSLVQIGAKLYEVDTGKIFIFDGTGWIDNPFSEGGSGGTGSVNWTSTQW
ncbi:MAG: hypothetical protein Q8936_22440 [Bacillota bacterium]|nr:hypothetical protein [Bacillota bacterium]